MVSFRIQISFVTLLNGSRLCLTCFLTLLYRSVRAKHFLIHEGGVVKLSGLRTVAPMIEEGSRLKVSEKGFLA